MRRLVDSIRSLRGPAPGPDDRLRPEDRSKWRRRALTGFALPMFGAVVMTVVITTVIAGSRGMLLSWLFFIAVGELALIQLHRWEADHLALQCPECGVRFPATRRQFSRAPWIWKGVSYRRVKCPNGHWGWAEVVSRSPEVISERR